MSKWRGNYFPEMTARLRRIFPDLSDGAIRHACNKIGNEIRNAPYDVHDVTFSAEPFTHADGFCTFFEVEASGVKVYVMVYVD